MIAPYYEDADIRIFCGDARDILPELSGVACVVSSPPYNVGIDYDASADDWDWGQYWAGAIGVANGTHDCTIPGARVWWNTAVSVPKDPTEKGETKEREPLAYGWLDVLRSAGFDYCDTISWPSARGSGTAWGSYESPTSPNLRGDYEVIQLMYRDRWEREAPPGYKGWRDGEGDWPKLCSTVWDGIAPARRDNGGHPVPFPLAVPTRCIRLSTWPGETVLDPYMGSGTTLLAARNLGRKAIGVDVSEAYCAMAAARLSQGNLFGAA